MKKFDWLFAIRGSRYKIDTLFSKFRDKMIVGKIWEDSMPGRGTSAFLFSLTNLPELVSGRFFYKRRGVVKPGVFGSIGYFLSFPAEEYK